MTTYTTSVTHAYDADGNLTACSAARDMRHYWPDGTWSLTGLGFCPCDPDELGPVVSVPWESGGVAIPDSAWRRCAEDLP